jgi:RNA polymerase sigma factor for flagellar operon FliA
MDAEKRFLENLPTIERIAAFHCRRMRMTDADTEDFVSYTKLELIKGDYEIIGKFEERSEFTTYLTTVIHRLLSQYRTKAWGKWRPSAEAKRLGSAAIALERLTTRDGYSTREAIELMTTGSAPVASRRELEAILLRLPSRVPRTMLVSDENAPDIAAADDPADAILTVEREAQARRAAAVIDEAMAALEPEDQMILKLRFWNARQIAEIAEMLHLDPKRTYKRLDKLLARLRVALERAGITARAMQDLLAHDEVIEIAAEEEISSTRPSNETAGKSGGSRGRR